jgi:two-component system nitrate/nitrite response regulator NarL
MDDAGVVATILVDLCALQREGLLRIFGETKFRILHYLPSYDEWPHFTLDNQKNVLIIVGACSDPELFVNHVRRLLEHCPSARVVVIGDLYPPKQLISVIQSGVQAFLPRSVSAEALVKTLDLVMLGETILPAGIVSAISSHFTERNDAPPLVPQIYESTSDSALHRLSEREVETLYCLLHGDSNKIIARKFTIAEATVKVHVKAILRKIRVNNRTQAAIWAMNNLPAGSGTRGGAAAEGRAAEFSLHSRPVDQQLVT